MALGSFHVQDSSATRIADAVTLDGGQGLLELGDVTDRISGIHHRDGGDADDQSRDGERTSETSRRRGFVIEGYLLPPIDDLTGRTRRSPIPPRSERIHSERLTTTWNRACLGASSIILRWPGRLLTPVTPRVTIFLWNRKGLSRLENDLGTAAEVAAGPQGPGKFPSSRR